MLVLIDMVDRKEREKTKIKNRIIKWEPKVVKKFYIDVFQGKIQIEQQEDSVLLSDLILSKKKKKRYNCSCLLGSDKTGMLQYNLIYCTVNDFIVNEWAEVNANFYFDKLPNVTWNISMSFFRRLSEKYHWLN